MNTNETTASSQDVIIIEAEDMSRDDYRIIQNSEASGGAFAQIRGSDGTLTTGFDGPSGT